MPTPRKLSAGWADVGSFLTAGDAADQWGWKTGAHAKGNLKLHNYLKYGDTEQHLGILPNKQAIYLVAPLEIVKDQLIRVA